MKKYKVGIQSITGCAGCQLTIYFIRDILLDILGVIDLVAAPMIKSKNSDGPYDILFVEGLVANQNDKKKLVEWRKKSKVLIALGACASHGCTPAIKNFIDDKIVHSPYAKTNHLKSVKPTPLTEHVTVDAKIVGCPPNRDEITTILKDVLLGKKIRENPNPVCHECSLKENNCLLELGRECMGPVINGGCEALCPSVNHSCTGCRGPIPDANIQSYFDLLLEKGISVELAKERLNKYAGLAFEKLIDTPESREHHDEAHCCYDMHGIKDKHLGE
ncbi:oxidoreductase [Candidatus Woesearchaeota archaeon]|nr:oxidoreductase [Candidatus Woesearchaeota archaeon]